MKQKGFTLAELLGVIVIIGLLLLLIIPLIINGVKNKEEDVEQTRDQIIFEAVGEYLDSDKEKYPNIPGSVYCVSLKDLKNSGFLVDPVKKIVEDGDLEDEFTIEIVISKDGVRKFSINNEDCEPYKSDKIEMVIKPSNSKWSREKTVTIYYPEECGEKYICTYQKDEEEVQTVPSGNSATITFDKNGTIYAHMQGKSEIEKTEKVKKIDIENPIVQKIELVKPWTMDYKQQINITLTDAHSGVGGYCVKKDTNKPKENDPCFKTVRFPANGGVGTVTEFLGKGQYYIFVKDRVGNISDYDPNNKNLSFEVQDTTPPTCRITTNETPIKGWFNRNVTVKVEPSDSYSGVKSYDITTSPSDPFNNTTHSYRVIYNNPAQIILRQDTSINGQIYYGFVEDRAGNKAKCSGVVKRDTAGPIFHGGGEVSTGYVNNAVFSDALSGLNRVEYIFSESGDTPSPNAAWSGATTGTTECGKTIYVFTKGTDNVGNYTIIYLGSYYTGSCIPRSTCHIRGNTIRNAGFSWKCDPAGHTHTKYYQVYCTDENGNIYEKPSPGRFVCPTRPYSESDGWYVIDD